ncbi:helix-turn-helix domain-containing protein [Streptomyces sp. NPDC097595]|uniref:helix-turn-helix domain-containing protein n=1 Tax=Streptomyces sp. NPDC097595 TaxID=3366090 RepID=UPI003809E047
MRGDDGPCHAAPGAVSAVRAGIADYPPGAVFGPRPLHDWELVWLLSGTAVWTRGAERVPLRPGTLLLIPPGAPDTLVWDSVASSSHGFVHFTLADGAPVGGVRSWPLTREGPLGGWCAYVLWLERDPLPRAHARQALVVSLLVDTLLRGPVPESAEGVRLPGPLIAAAEAVGRVWAESRGPVPIGLEPLCSAAASSRRRLCRLASEAFGMGPVAAVEAVRLTRVASLLDQSDMPVAAVARACGYASPFHLSRRFRARYGMPPTVYRETTRVPGTAPPGPAGDSAALRAFEDIVRRAQHNHELRSGP